MKKVTFLLMWVSVAGFTFFTGGCVRRGAAVQQPDNPARPLVINGKPANIVYLTNEASSAWQVASTGFLKNLIERAGGRCTILSADLEPERQVRQAQELLVTRPDLIVVKPTDSAAIVPAIRQLNQAGIPVFSLDVRPDPGCEIFTHIQSDQLQLGGLGAQYLADKFRKAGKTARV
ncbi:MAG: substrate-binding domain-containing protein, partial [Treponema sp.]|nr:substrate-binding domain-containing protein [Treponema sp.]